MINKICNKMNACVLLNKHFGFKYAFVEFLSTFIFRHNGYIKKKIIKIQYDNIKEWIKNKYYYKVINFLYEKKTIEECFKIDENAPIWIFWWQGIENAPVLVKKCIKSIQEHKGNHNIVLLTSENIKNYIEIPQYILDKVDNKIISIPHLADMVRTQLLYKYGGIWMDSTLFMTAEFSKELYRYYFYTIHHTQRSDYHICKGLWSTFFMASGKGNPFFYYLTKAQQEYWKYENAPICYLLIDCFIALGYENDMYIKSMIDNVPVNNTKTMSMAECFNSDYSQELLNDICQNTYLHKLSNKLHVESNSNNLYSVMFSD